MRSPVALGQHRIKVARIGQIYDAGAVPFVEDIQFAFESGRVQPLGAQGDCLMAGGRHEKNQAANGEIRFASAQVVEPDDAECQNASATGVFRRRCDSGHS